MVGGRPTSPDELFAVMAQGENDNNLPVGLRAQRTDCWA